MKENIRAVLLDITGTLVEKGAWIPGADKVVRRLIERSLIVRLISNTTIKSRRLIGQQFEAMGLAIDSDWIFTPARAAQAWLKLKKPVHGILPLIHPDLLEDLNGLHLTDGDKADYVLVGDMNDKWNPGVLNLALRALLSGSKLIALQKGRRWIAEDGYRLDCGAYVAALEYAAGLKCEVVFGKPNPVFYQMVLADAGVLPSEAIMIGDDIESDYVGSRQCGIRGLLVQTGKSATPGQLPDGINRNDIIDSITELPAWFEIG